METKRRDKRDGWGEDRPGGQAFSVIKPTLQLDREKDKRRKKVPPMLHEELRKK